MDDVADADVDQSLPLTSSPLNPELLNPETLNPEPLNPSFNPVTTVLATIPPLVQITNAPDTGSTNTPAAQTNILPQAVTTLSSFTTPRSNDAITPPVPPTAPKLPPTSNTIVKTPANPAVPSANLDSGSPTSYPAEVTGQAEVIGQSISNIASLSSSSDQSAVVTPSALLDNAPVGADVVGNGEGAGVVSSGVSSESNVTQALIGANPAASASDEIVGNLANASLPAAAESSDPSDATPDASTQNGVIQSAPQNGTVENRAMNVPLSTSMTRNSTDSQSSTGPGALSKAPPMAGGVDSDTSSLLPVEPSSSSSSQAITHNTSSQDDGTTHDAPVANVVANQGTSSNLSTTSATTFPIIAHNTSQAPTLKSGTEAELEEEEEEEMEEEEEFEEFLETLGFEVESEESFEDDDDDDAPSLNYFSPYIPTNSSSSGISWSMLSILINTLKVAMFALHSISRFSH